MVGLLRDFCAAFAAAMLLAGGTAHALRFPAFRRLVAEHGVVGRRWAAATSALVAGYELAVGVLLAAVPVAPGVAAFATPAFASAAIVGAAFWLYVRRLLDRPWRPASCGCSAFGSPLTPASLTHSAALAGVSLVGIGTASAGAAGAGSPELVVLAILWGCTLAGLVELFTAAVPSAVGRWSW